MRSVACTALTMLVTEVYSKGHGQIIAQGSLNTVDEDNNIVGDVPLYDLSPPHHKAGVVEKVSFVLKCILFLALIAGLIYGVVYVYRKFGHKLPEIKRSKPNSKSNTQPSFSMFTNEEVASTADGERASESRSMGNLFGLTRPPTPPPKKTFG